MIVNLFWLVLLLHLSFRLLGVAYNAVHSLDVSALLLFVPFPFSNSSLRVTCGPSRTVIWYVSIVLGSVTTSGHCRTPHLPRYRYLILMKPFMTRLTGRLQELNAASSLSQSLQRLLLCQHPFVFLSVEP